MIGEQTFNKSLTKNAAQASKMEIESAEAIAANLENMTGNKPVIINTGKNRKF